MKKGYEICWEHIQGNFPQGMLGRDESVSWTVYGLGRQTVHDTEEKKIR